MFLQEIKSYKNILVAERMGFEPMCLLGKRFSRPPRYDRFDTSPLSQDLYILSYRFTKVNKKVLYNLKIYFFILLSAKNRPYGRFQTVDKVPKGALFFCKKDEKRGEVWYN